VVSLIVDIQREALLDGLEKLKPLSLKEVALLAGLHESTISRVVNNKYVQTPAGVHALRDFFATALKTTEGADISNQRLKMRVQELIEEEDKTHPLNDAKIAALIAATEKVPLARRTIAKYREALSIPTASKRRKK
jgi:RNA polymerase sigma-54 factor